MNSSGGDSYVKSTRQGTTVLWWDYFFILHCILRFRKSSLFIITIVLIGLWMHINQNGVDLIMEFEGVRLTAYQDSVGVWTIGYGHTSAAGEPKVTRGLKITKEQAIRILKKDLVTYENYVIGALGEAVEQLTDNQFAALVSLCYNIGPGNFKKSTVARAIKRGDLQLAGDAILMWNKAGGKRLAGLVRRRHAERALFLK